ncbi:hypothetical protein B4U45_08175 [Mycobacterium persicum]|uniref:Lipoprotein LpqV n=1 Tax=Mycobacterium persicum TaxID=1487726 RepID=A0A8E2IP48_9MYCO|nr:MULTISPECIES: lipoprotein LpqV [Mycobacterium]KZS85561.1 hypothetical protein A4G31_07505 [Mycobacterium persicum]ORB39107.1 hypothetical protein BST40_22755 [Mycobacterium persicum]ORB94519.1 hypothetical protein B1T44_08295 [Mycobacterium persicum]ORC01206.1 hypothetical protein B1T48_07675 [Mycobacterium persicum]ORC06607.1 hypothetical protein B4U45_08175 [Mycobacterium persicum]
MRGSRPRGPACAYLWGPLVVAASVSVVTGCWHTGGDRTASSSSAKSSALSPTAPSSLPPGVVGVSPTGVTTRVDVPAESTEEQYFQACHAAKVWMQTQPVTGEAVIEPYLAMVQASQSGVAGSWNIRWAELTPARQAAVIVAAVAAANNECG